MPIPGPSEYFREAIPLRVCSECGTRGKWVLDGHLGYAIYCDCDDDPEMAFPRDGHHESREEAQASWNNLNAGQSWFSDDALPDLSDFD